MPCWFGFRQLPACRHCGAQSSQIVSYFWSNGITAPSGEFVYLEPGIYTETLTVTDDDGATATDTVVVTVVDNYAPVANAGADVTVEPNKTVTLNGAASSDANGTIVSYDWSNGLTGDVVTTSFAAEGTYTITLTVTDDQGATATDTVVVTVKAKPTTVNVTFTCNNGTTVLGQNVYVVGNLAQLGSWNTAKAIKLSPTAYPRWTGTIALPPGTAVQWKCIKRDVGSVVWQSGSNNSFTSVTSGTQSVSASF